MYKKLGKRKVHEQGLQVFLSGTDLVAYTDRIAEVTTNKSYELDTFDEIADR